MISFSAETSFELSNPQFTGDWLGSIISQEGYSEGEISVVFCDDKHLFKLNVEFLNHDTLTDVIGFNYSVGNEIYGEIFISIDRVEHNAVEFGQAFKTELFKGYGSWCSSFLWLQRQDQVRVLTDEVKRRLLPQSTQ
jgi:ssRNA-specific RNase YbeY (16S rRNA maturation enzyme)